MATNNSHWIVWKVHVDVLFVTIWGDVRCESIVRKQNENKWSENVHKNLCLNDLCLYFLIHVKRSSKRGPKQEWLSGARRAGDPDLLVCFGNGNSGFTGFVAQVTATTLDISSFNIRTSDLSNQSLDLVYSRKCELDVPSRWNHFQRWIARPSSV